MKVEVDLNKMDELASKEFQRMCRRRGVTPEILFLRCAESRLRELAFADPHDLEPLFRLLNDLLPDQEEIE